MVALAKPSFAEESGHWYEPDGTPRYTVIGKNGRERGTTIRDARELGLLPSVTTICSIIAKPGLVNWMVDQAVLAALTGTRREGEDDGAFIPRMKREAREESDRAAQMGTLIHGQIEKHYRGEAIDAPYELFVRGVVEKVDRYFPGFDWYTERSFAHDGYAGKVDLHGRKGEMCAVIDFKGKEGPLDEVETYPEHWMQLAAYAAGLFPGVPLENIYAANCFFSRTHPGNTLLVVHSKDCLMKGLEMFRAAKALWCAMKGYYPKG